jgi:hypothetical protein
VNKEEKWHPEEVWVVGDVFAGLNPLERGRGVRGSLDEQMKCAVELLEMLPDDVLIKVWSGSAYHESVDVRMHERLVDNLKLDGFQAKFRGSWSVEQIGKRKNAFVAHEASSSIMYPATVMARDVNYFKIAAFDGKLPEIHLVVRAHEGYSVAVLVRVYAVSKGDKNVSSLAVRHRCNVHFLGRGR